MALAWTLALALNVLLIPGTSPGRHREENLAVADLVSDHLVRDEPNAEGSSPEPAVP